MSAHANRLLVVDDEPDIVLVMKKYFASHNFAVDAFTNPQEAIDRFKPDYYSIVITDIRMPHINGFDLYRELKKKDPNIKVAFMTAFEVYENEFNKVMPSINAACFFKKPIRLAEIEDRVRKEIMT